MRRHLRKWSITDVQRKLYDQHQTYNVLTEKLRLQEAMHVVSHRPLRVPVFLADDFRDSQSVRAEALFTSSPL